MSEEENQIKSAFINKDYDDLFEVETDIVLMDVESLLNYSYVANKILFTDTTE